MHDALIRVARSSRWRLDAGLALGLALWSAIQLQSGPQLSHELSIAVWACVMTSCGALVVRGAYPLAAGVVVGATITLAGLLTGPALSNYLPDAVQAVFALLAFSIGAHERGWRTWLGLACVLLADNEGDLTFVDPVPMFVFGVPPWLAGQALQSRRRFAAALATRARELELERERFAQESVRHERALISRELHDLVAHNVSAMVVQASAGQHLAERDPTAAANSLENIAQAAEQAQSEMRALIKLLSSDRAPTNGIGIAPIRELVARAQTSGLPVAANLETGQTLLAPEIAEVAYRLAQEALTNSLKHAPGAAIRISVEDQHDHVLLTVCNAPSGDRRSGLESSGGGFGLDGMRERVTACGGTLHAGPTPDGGWCVTARLPNQAEPAHPQGGQRLTKIGREADDSAHPVP